MLEEKKVAPDLTFIEQMFYPEFMGRGGYGTGNGLPLSERRRVGDETPQPVSGATEPPARHCWVSLPVDGSSARPGLLLEWRQVDRGRWEGRVVYVAQLRPGQWAVVQEWVAAELLTADQLPGPGR